MIFVSNTAKFRMVMRMRCPVNHDADVYAPNAINVDMMKAQINNKNICKIRECLKNETDLSKL